MNGGYCHGCGKLANECTGMFGYCDPDKIHQRRAKEGWPPIDRQEAKKPKRTIDLSVYLIMQVKLYDGQRDTKSTYRQCAERAKIVVDGILDLNDVEVAK